MPTARSWTASSRRRLPGRDQHHPAGPRPRALLATIAREKVSSCSAPRRCGSRCCAPRLRHDGPPACGRATTAPPHARGGAPRPCSGGSDVQLWNFYGRPRCPSARSSGPTSSSPGRLGWAGRAERRDDAGRRRRQPGGPGEVGEIVHRSPHAAWATTTTRRRRPRRSQAAGSSRRPGRHDRGRLPLRRRPQEGHDQDRRRERGQPGDRGVYELEGVAEVAVFGISHTGSRR